MEDLTIKMGAGFAQNIWDLSIPQQTHPKSRSRKSASHSAKIKRKANINPEQPGKICGLPNINQVNATDVFLAVPGLPNLNQVLAQ